MLATFAGADQSAIALFRERKFVEAERTIQASLRRQPNQPSVRLLLARTLIELRRVPEALLELERLLATQPSPEIEMEAGRLLRRLAEDRFQDLARSGAGNAAVLAISGRRLEQSGDFAGAKARYAEAIRLESDRPGLRYALGAVEWKLGETEAAERDLRLELARTPDHGMANFRLGQVLLATNREADAVVPLERAVSAMPSRPEVLRELGKAYRKAGRSAEARRAWETVAKLRPADDQVHFLLGTLYRELGETALAQRELATHRQLLDARRERSERK